MIIAWRIIYLTMLGRSYPDIRCDMVFEQHEWKSVYAIVRKKDAPEIPPALNEMLDIIAILGGYIKKPNSFAGVKTVWLGLKRMHDFALAFQTFQQLKIRE